MAAALKTAPVYVLASVVLLGAFSRFTHGAYTPTWYAFQEYHLPDDNSTVARLTPVIDMLVGLTLLFGRTRTPKLLAASLSLFFFTAGLAMQVQKGKQYTGDVALVVVAVAAVARLLAR
ncbi:uncharacterized protein Z520_02478 [Fonsecaea multimorphosa CBS 102226]|uniref:Methylamine utilisation protein MauE domain-containing protein n=1 Tax=Fonsecaea multimorphosa CBS 102226 TaxID=1442371 RepID=A0A0D2KFV6_9EURO|nr:uncharacterized protein Z520_02478 [Fonsecaea multimorphosa CBS 102226]KIY02340.1 hypothetical protein Z520_02478 [Fonsecaea multimorphosa CBS 102226]OAL28984.1 hypothetical protein AYO22_02420 [Fonsecaea multimorphosa]